MVSQRPDIDFGGGKPKRNVLPTLLVLLLLGAAALAGYVFLFRGSSTESPNAVGAIVVDRTGSSNAQDVRKLYLDVGEKALDGFVEARTVTSVYYFANQGSKLQSAGADTYGLYQGEAEGGLSPEEQRDDNLEEAQSALSSALDAPSGRGRLSDIVTAIDQAATNLHASAASEETVSEKYLFVFTDGQQNSADFNVNRSARKQGDRFDARASVKQISDLGRLPDLRGVTVYFVGVDRGELNNRQLSVQHEENLAEFWAEFVDRADGEIGGYQNDYTSIDLGD